MARMRFRVFKTQVPVIVEDFADSYAYRRRKSGKTIEQSSLAALIVALRREVGEIGVPVDIVVDFEIPHHIEASTKGLMPIRCIMLSEEEQQQFWKLFTGSKE